MCRVLLLQKTGRCVANAGILSVPAATLTNSRIRHHSGLQCQVLAEMLTNSWRINDIIRNDNKNARKVNEHPFFYLSPPIYWNNLQWILPHRTLLPPGSSGHDNEGNGNDNDRRGRRRYQSISHLCGVFGCSFFGPSNLGLFGFPFNHVREKIKK